MLVLVVFLMIWFVIVVCSIKILFDVLYQLFSKRGLLIIYRQINFLFRITLNVENLSVVFNYIINSNVYN